MNNEDNQTDFQNVLLALIGAYLIYLAYQLITGNSGGGGSAIGWIIAAVIFGVIGILVIIRSAVRIYRNHKNKE